MRFPAFMFFPEKYWLDAYDLSDAEHGIYLRLMILQWNSPSCRLPNDDAWLAPKLGRSVQAVEEQIRPIIRRFFKTDGNWIYQGRLREEFDRLVRLSSRGTAANKSRWKKKKTSSQTDPKKHDVGSIKESYPTPTPTPTLKESKLRAGKEWGPEFIAWYAAYPKKVDPGRAAKAYRTARKLASAAELLDGAQRYAAECDGKDRQYVKHPTTWLNAQSWRNEPSLLSGVVPPRPNGHSTGPPIERKPKAPVVDSPEYYRQRREAGITD